MSAAVTLFEHESTEGFEWTDCEYAALERLNRAAGKEILRATVRAGRRELRAGHHVGLVRLGARSLQVLPKMYRGGTRGAGERAEEATRNLLHLLAYAGTVPVREQALAPLLRRGSDWFEILTRLFASHLSEEWQRGAHRHYQLVEDELPLLKGRWRVAEHARHPARRHLFAVAYDEFTADNPLNRVFRLVVERLWRLTRDGDNRRLLGELRQWMEEVSLPAHVAPAEARAAALTRLNARYEPLLNLARLFLEGGSLQLAARDFNSFAFVFDMNQLFEAFLVGFVRRHRDRVLPHELRDCDLLPQSHGAPHHLARDERHQPVFQLRPDLALRRGPHFPLLIDAKHKRLDPADRKLGIAPADFYQMHAYARRYRSPRVLLLYPQTADHAAPQRARFRVEEAEAIIQAATINLQVELGTETGRAALADELRALLSGATTTHD